MEKLDIYNGDKVRSGRVVERDLIERLGLGEDEFVLAIQCWIINGDNKILLTRRRLDKFRGGMWEPTSGLAQAGEEGPVAVMRELYEEIGLRVDVFDLTLYKTVNSHNVFRDIFLLKKDVSLDEISFIDGEVIDAKFVSLDEFAGMVERGEAFDWFGWFFDEFEEIIKV